MSQRLQVSVVGAGRAARELTIPALRLLASEATFCAICDVDLARAEALVQHDEGAKAYSDLGQMLAKQKPDILVINTPVAHHFEAVMTAIDHGIHVLIEKPAMETLDQLEQVQVAAEKNGLKASVIHNYKYMPGPTGAWKLYQEGVIGEVLHIDRVWMSPPQHDRMERDSEGWWHRLPGGRLADSLPHHLYISYPYTGDMSVEYVGVRKMATDRPWSKCDEAEIILKAKRAYLNIRLSTNQVSWTGKGMTYHAILWGTKNNLIVHQNEAAIMPCGDRRYWLRKGIDVLVNGVKRRLGLSRGEPWAVRGAHNLFFRAFFDCVRGAGPNPTPWDEATSVMRLTQEIANRMEAEIRSMKSRSDEV